MKALDILRKHLIGKKLISASDIELNDDGNININYYTENNIVVPKLGEIITDVTEGMSVDGYAVINLYFNDNEYYDIFLDENIEVE